MKQVKISEEQVRQIIAETAKKILKEAGYDAEKKKQAYLKITQAIDEFKEFLETTYGNGSESNKLYDACDSLILQLDDFFRHPDLGGSYKEWDSAGF